MWNGCLWKPLSNRFNHLVKQTRKDEQWIGSRSEEHTSELQSRLHLVCRLLLEKKKSTTTSVDGYQKQMPGGPSSLRGWSTILILAASVRPVGVLIQNTAP